MAPMDHRITDNPRPSTFAGLCELCDWQGRERRDSLGALTDYDRHLASKRHADTVAKIGRQRPEPECHMPYWFDPDTRACEHPDHEEELIEA